MWISKTMTKKIKKKAVRSNLKAQQSPKKKVARKRRSHYHTGTHASYKSITPVSYRSGWELTVAKFLDYDPNVIAYAYEALAIPYVSNLKSGKVRRYYPDFFVKYKNGVKLVIEVKRESHLTNATVIKKAEAAKKWCEQYGYQYQFWTNKDIEKLRKFNESIEKKNDNSPKK